MSTAGLDMATGSRSAIRAVFIVSAVVSLVTLGWYGGAAADGTHGAIVTESGPLTGATVNGVREYLGIPYAAPPVGSLRWMPPQSFGKWKGLLQATHFGSECPQAPSPFGTASNDEDCLFLNVYTPTGEEGESKSHRRVPADKHRTGRPVMVWIHGGGLLVGGGDLYDPTPLVKQGGVIAVTINYRLGLLGFFAHPALDQEGHLAGNYGLMDQQFALRWVQRNIAAFGGDPKRVTLFGESAGAQSVYSQLASPLAAGLFDRAIAESGSYASFTDYTPWIIPIAAAETNGSLVVPAGTAFASAVGCTSQTAACLRSMSPAVLLGATAELIALYPFVDGALLTQTPGAAFASGQFNRVPVISGTNHDEDRLFVALAYDLNPAVGPLTNAGYTAAVDTSWGPVFAPIVLANYPLPPMPPADAASIALAASVTDGIYSCPARLADESLAQYVSIYAYEFNDENAPFGLGSLSFPSGAFHGAETQYLFNIRGTPAPFTSDQQDLSAAMISYWTHFAKNGDPNSAEADTPTWSPYSPETDQFQSFVPPAPTVESDFAADHQCNVGMGWNTK